VPIATAIAVVVVAGVILGFAVTPSGSSLLAEPGKIRDK
jgi:hypothetical protein